MREQRRKVAEWRAEKEAEKEADRVLEEQKREERRRTAEQRELERRARKREMVAGFRRRCAAAEEAKERARAEASKRDIPPAEACVTHRFRYGKGLLKHEIISILHPFGRRALARRRAAEALQAAKERRAVLSRERRERMRRELRAEGLIVREEGDLLVGARPAPAAQAARNPERLYRATASARAAGDSDVEAAGERDGRVGREAPVPSSAGAFDRDAGRVDFTFGTGSRRATAGWRRGM